MNETQEAIFAQIESLAREHFDAAVLVVMTERDDKQQATSCTWHGGYATSLGILEIARQKMHEKKDSPADPENNFSQ